MADIANVIILVFALFVLSVIVYLESKRNVKLMFIAGEAIRTAIDYDLWICRYIDLKDLSKGVVDELDSMRRDLMKLAKDFRDI